MSSADNYFCSDSDEDLALCVALKRSKVDTGILGKAEFLNPGGSVKDRVAVKIIEEALKSGDLVCGGVVTEGSAGSTAISLATVAPAYGCRFSMGRKGLVEAVGNTPLIRINSLSDATGCEILGKAEFLNPGGSVKDRVAVKIIEEALKSGDLVCGGVVTEGSAGSTAISLATVAPAYGCRCHVVIPDDAAVEKGGFFADQFENMANYQVHYEWTGPEIWKQTKGTVHAFVAAAGTGGTIAGVSRYLKEMNRNVRCFLMDPPGSGLFNKVTRGVMYTKEEAEGKRLKNPFDTITEGIGINRVTANFMMAELDGAYRGTDREAVEMSSPPLTDQPISLIL
ncbi:Cysteine synthase 2 [Triticum urartu]|uniref:cysteine synthase n=1 Tax=Triticum urartu TaxID=4572 RepID=M8AM58_TRIUA|nr:Cysteine synthase 2 [Triticum urartu]